MGIKADIETAEGIKEHLEEVSIPDLEEKIAAIKDPTLEELEETLAATLRIVTWIKEQIQIKKGTA